MTGMEGANSTELHEIRPEVADRLGYYVYIYLDPRSDKPFYVGKGRGRRVLAHLSEKNESRKVATIAELSALGLQPQLDILAHGLPDEETALRIEAAAIDLLGLDQLTNLVKGWKSVHFGRRSLRELDSYYAAKPVEITDPALLIRITRLYRHNMTEAELYDATRGHWKLGLRRTKARLALAVFDSVVREVYSIDSWHPAGTTPRNSALHLGPTKSDRWEFTGSVANEPIRAKYRGRSVARYLPKGLQSPVVYVRC